ncbi:MAG TPA: HAMP domain-containing sensor histidine kinase [Smithellaceae bacterium]|nr:HAMP domain-containing sensor histidine kinase [Smithellaceae bacterium]HRS89278.1 HAMP domain-containing sensor histidine kinase [Smithellaceae bacterium]HRV27054.1 HAMP domain-containing sensor histidine kinase [Smithellaceae bacterium]
MDDFFSASNCPAMKNKGPGNCLYAYIMENIDLGIVILGLKRHEIIFKNKFASELFQDAKEKLGYKALMTLLLPTYGESSHNEIIGKTNTLWYKNRLLGYTPYMISDDFIWIIIRDITERSRLESIAEAVNSMENTSYIFSGIRHELGNPINSIKMTLSVLKKNLAHYSTSAVERFVDRAMTEISRVEFLLQALKSFSLFENPDIQNVHVEDFIKRFISLVSNDLGNAGIKTNYVVVPPVEHISADPRLLHQVILNLITNASDALHNCENPQIMIRAERKEGFVAITIEDNGIGMTEEEQTNLFKPFYTTKQRGTGLGLMIALKMVTLMKGNMEIKSYKDIGTKVTIFIPEGRHDART